MDKEDFDHENRIYTLEGDMKILKKIIEKIFCNSIEDLYNNL